MARLKDLSETTAEIYNINLSLLVVEDGYNVRHDSPAVREHIAMLRDSMLNQGYLRSKPLIVRLSKDQATATIVDGHCRFAAAKLAVAAGAEIASIPCVSEGKHVSRMDRDLMLLTANSGLPLAPLEQAEVVKRLLSYGWSETQIGDKIGRTRQHVANLLELAGAPDGVKIMVVDGIVSATEAIKVVRRDGDDATRVLEDAVRVAAAAGKGRITARTIEATRPKPATPPPAPPRALPAPPAPSAPVTVASRLLVDGVVPLSVAAAHVVEMAKGQMLAVELRRAIDALHMSLS